MFSNDAHGHIYHGYLPSYDLCLVFGEQAKEFTPQLMAHMPELPKRKKQTYVRIKIAAIQYNGQVICNNGLSVLLNMKKKKKREN